MHLLTILSSLIVLAGARPVPQSVLPTDIPDSASLNSTSTISVQDALSLLSLGIPASATSDSAAPAASSVISDSTPSQALTSAAASIDLASLTGTDLAVPTTSQNPTAGISTDTATVAFSSDLSLPTASTDDDDSDDSSTGPTDSADSSSDLPLPTASPTDDGDDDDGGSDTASSAALPTGLAYIIPTNIPQACLAKAATVLSPSSVLTSGIVATSAPSVDLSSLLSSISSGSVPASNVAATDLPASSISADNASATVSSLASDSGSVALASATASIDSALPVPTSTVNSTSTDSTTTSSTLSKRIAQLDLPDVAQSWQDLCLVSGGDIFTNEPCVQLAGINGINALLATADPCDQQDNADAMVDFAKSTGVTNSEALIANAVVYRQHPRNALNINGVVPSTPYCQRAPRNAELEGLVNAQLDGVNPGIFGSPSIGLVAFGDPSSCPLGTSPDPDSCSCS